DLNLMNGLKTGLSFVLSAISVATFALAGLVAWPQALVMMAAATAGGYAGGPLARALPRSVVRPVVLVCGTVLSAIILWRLVARGTSQEGRVGNARLTPRLSGHIRIARGTTRASSNIPGRPGPPQRRVGTWPDRSSSSKSPRLFDLSRWAAMN